jgi:hypothetical protein
MELLLSAVFIARCQQISAAPRFFALFISFRAGQCDYNFRQKLLSRNLGRRDSVKRL